MRDSKIILIFLCCSFTFLLGQRSVPDTIAKRLVIRNINIIAKVLKEYALKHNNYPQTLTEFLKYLPADFKNPVDSTYDAIAEKVTNTPGTIFYKFLPPNGFEITANDANGNKLPYLFTSEPKLDIKGTAVPVWCYFPKNGTQSPTGEPNWYYYWSQTSASVGEHIYDPTIGTPFMGEYRYGESFFRVGHLARTSCGPGEQFKGIDCFARVCLHEDNHLNDWWNFWPNGYDPDRDKDTTGDGIVTGDQIPDEWEVGLGFDPSRAHTHPPWLDFTYYSEPRSQLAEERWINGSADHEDWSAPGKQYGGNVAE